MLNLAIGHLMIQQLQKVLNKIIFTSQPNIIMDARVHSLPHEKFHHQIIYSKLNIKTEYPPPCSRRIWDCSRSETYSVTHFFHKNKLYKNKDAEIG